MMTDFEVSDRGSLWLITPLTPAAHEWIAEHIPADALTWMSSIVIEPRYVQAIVDAITEEGMTYDPD